MGAFTNSAITEAGRVLLAEVQAGAVFTPTRLVIGSGSIPNGKTAQTMTNVVSVVKSLAINKKQRTPDGKAIFGAVYSNEDITTAFYFRELALYAKPVHLNADGTVASEGAEVLYTYGNAGDSADYMPAYSTSTVVEKQIDIVTYVGHDTQVDLTIGSGIYITQAEKGAAGGVASLDEAGKLHEEQLPDDVPVLANGKTMYLNDKSAAVSASNGRAVLNSYKTPGSNAEYRSLIVRNRNETEELSQAFCLGVKDGNGYEWIYAIYGEHNKPTAEDVGARKNTTVLTTTPPETWGDVESLGGGEHEWVQTGPLEWEPNDTPTGMVRAVLSTFPGVGNTYFLRYIDGSANKTMYFGEMNRWTRVATTDYAVPTTRKVNGKALSADINLVPADVGAASTATYTATVTKSWIEAVDCYYQNITVNGILATDNPIVDIAPGNDNSANQLYSEAMCKVFRIAITDANTIQVMATEAIDIAFPIRLKVVR